MKQQQQQQQQQQIQGKMQHKKRIPQKSKIYQVVIVII